MTCHLFRRHRPGWTLLETLIVLLIGGILAGLVTLGTQFGQEQTLDEQSRRLLQRIRAARTDAVMTATQARIYFQEGEGEEGLGRYLSVQLESGQDSAHASDGDWVSLRDHVTFATGEATTGPLGDSAATAVPLQEIQCNNAGACELDGQATVTYYLADTRSPGSVRALTVSQTGDARLYTYEPETDQWK